MDNPGMFTLWYPGHQRDRCPPTVDLLPCHVHTMLFVPRGSYETRQLGACMPDRYSGGPDF